jgi:outer membrane lipoprotein-sorting protein
MKRFLFLILGLLSIASSATATDTKPAVKMSVADIVERNAAARGGLAAWRAVDTLTLAGMMDAGGKQNTELPFVMKMKRPHKTRLELTFADQLAVQVYDGESGWKLRPFLGRDEAEPFTPAEAKAAASWVDLDGLLIDHARKGTQVEVLGSEAVEGKSAFKLKLTLKTGEVRNLWVDARTFLELKVDGEPRKIDGKLRKVAIYYRDYKAEKGLMVPRMLETEVEGVAPNHKMTISKVTISQPIDDAQFAKPAPTKLAGS